MLSKMAVVSILCLTLASCGATIGSLKQEPLDQGVHRSYDAAYERVVAAVQATSPPI